LSHCLIPEAAERLSGIQEHGVAGRARTLVFDRAAVFLDPGLSLRENRDDS